MTFAFGTADMIFDEIDEEEEESFEEVCEEDVSTVKARTETLAAAARERVAEMNNLLDKLSTGTATRAEKVRLEAINEKLADLKKEIESSKTRSSEKELAMLKSKTRSRTHGVMKAYKEKEIRSVIRSVCAAESVDLAFIIDCTGSMSSYIASVRENVKEIVRQVRRTNGNLNLRLAVVGYRDVGDTPRFEIFDFVKSVEQFEAFVSGLRASGGADEPEDMAGAIQKANGLSWEQPTQVVFLIADAPCHGREFHGCDDSYPGGTPGICITSELKMLQGGFHENGSISLNFGRITSGTDKMINVFETAGISFDVCDLKDLKRMTTCVTKSVRKSIFKTMTVSGAGKKSLSFAPVVDITSLSSYKTGSRRETPTSLKSYRVLSTGCSSFLGAERVHVFRNKPVKSINDLKAPLVFGMIKRGRRAKTDKTRESTMWMRRAENPFAEGEIRLAYRGQLARDKESLKEDKSSMVFKSFKHIGRGLNDRTQYLKQMEVSNIAYFLAKEYNEKNRPSHCARIRFLQVCVAEEEHEGNEDAGNRRFCAEEPLPEGPGTFTKYSNNTGFWNEEVLDQSLLCFTRFTNDVTGGYLMVTDLQGVRNGNEYILTDPVILCEDIMRFGHTNLGDKFMKKCMDTTCALLEENGWI